MTKHYWIGALLTFATCTSAQAQDFRKEFMTTYQSGDTAATSRVLKRWYAARPQDPEWYVTKFNYLLKLGEAVELRPGKEAGGLAIKDKKGRMVGALSSGYVPTMVEKACAVLRQGIAISPERLDMWFGLAKTYEETQQADEQVRVLTQALATHASSRQEWRWQGGGTLPAAEAEFVPQALEQYAAVYWQQNDPKAWETGRLLADLIVRYYPQSSLGPFNVGAYYGIKGEPKLAYPYLQQADKLQPNDPTNVMNLASIAIQLGYQADAKKYVARLKEFPNGAEAAKELSKKLK